MEPADEERVRRLEEADAKRTEREAPIEEPIPSQGGPQRPSDYICADGFFFSPCIECGKPMVLNLENYKTEWARVYVPYRSDRDGRDYVKVFPGFLCTETQSGGPGCWQKWRGTGSPKYGGYPALGGKNKEQNGRSDHEAWHRQQR
jgi:hypothetical protein